MIHESHPDLVHVPELLPAPAIAAATPERVKTQSGPPAVQATDLYAALLADARSPATARAREADVRDYARFVAASERVACAELVGGGRGLGNALATAYVRWMLDRHLSSATINRRLCTLRRLLVLAGKFEVASWSLDVDALPDQPYRDTAGPGQAGWVRVLATATGLARRAAAAKRNLAILRLLHDHGLRREEVASLDLAHYDPDAGQLWIQGKGQRSRAPIRLNKQTLLALSVYLDLRGNQPGPLFVRLDRARDSSQLQRLDGKGIHKAIATLGHRAGLSRGLWPHALRHAGVTRVLELNGGNLDQAQKFARHKDPRTPQRYNDNIDDVAGAMARLLGKDA